MKRLAALLIFSALAHAATSISLINLLMHCPATGTFFLMSVAGQITCVAAPSNVTVTGTPPAMTITAPAYTPQMQVESIPLSSLASTATSVTYTTLKPPVSGAIWWFYQSNNFALSDSGAVQLSATPNPITFALPANWQSTDAILIVYQSQ